VLDRAKANDFVYFDPPYIPLSVSSSFTSYTSDGFGMEEQRRLRDVAVELKKRGVKVLLSNSSAPAVRELYREHFKIEAVEAARSVNCKAGGRGKIKELVIYT
jgi:DNA adenine methylase